MPNRNNDKEKKIIMPKHNAWMIVVKFWLVANWRKWRHLVDDSNFYINFNEMANYYFFFSIHSPTFRLHYVYVEETHAKKQNDMRPISI